MPQPAKEPKEETQSVQVMVTNTGKYRHEHMASTDRYIRETFV